MSSIDFSTIEQSVGFRVPPRLIFEALTDAKIVSTFTQAPAVTDPKVGGEYSFFAGNVTGKYLELEPGKKLKFTWRFKEWVPEHYSTVTITLSEGPDGPNSTKLQLHHENVPHGDNYGNHAVVEKVTEGWQNFFWNRQFGGFHRRCGWELVAAAAADLVSSGEPTEWLTQCAIVLGLLGAFSSLGINRVLGYAKLDL